MELEKKKKDDLEVPKVNEKNWAKTMEATVIHLKLVKGVRGVQLEYMFRQHGKMAYMSPEYDEEIISWVCIVNTKLNLKQTQDSQDRAYVIWHCDTFIKDNASVYHILSKFFKDKGIYVLVKQRKSRQDGQAVLFNICKQYPCADNMAR